MLRILDNRNVAALGTAAFGLLSSSSLWGTCLAACSEAELAEWLLAPLSLLVLLDLLSMLTLLALLVPPSTVCVSTELSVRLGNDSCSKCDDVIGFGLLALEQLPLPRDDDSLLVSSIPDKRFRRLPPVEVREKDGCSFSPSSAPDMRLRRLGCL